MEPTALKEKATGEKRPATALELGTYALSRSFTHASHGDRSPCPIGPVYAIGPKFERGRWSFFPLSPFPLELWVPYRLLNNVYILGSFEVVD